MTFRAGRRLGVDVGSVRIGVASSDPAGVLATPLETVRRGKGDLDRIRALAVELDVIEVVVGLPRALDGSDGPAAEQARGFAAAVADRVDPVPVRLVDERMSTVVATRGMRAGGVTSRAGRQTVDRAAAVVILQGALDTERETGRPPGETVTR